MKIGFRSEHFAPADEEGPMGPVMPLELPIQFVEKSGARRSPSSTSPARPSPRRSSRAPPSATGGARLAAVKLQLDKVNVFDAGSGRGSEPR